MVVRSARSIPHSLVVDLQEFIATELQREVFLCTDQEVCEPRRGLLSDSGKAP